MICGILRGTLLLISNWEGEVSVRSIAVYRQPERPRLAVQPALQRQFIRHLKQLLKR